MWGGREQQPRAMFQGSTFGSLPIVGVLERMHRGGGGGVFLFFVSSSWLECLLLNFVVAGGDVSSHDSLGRSLGK